MLTAVTTAITSGVTGVMTSITSAIPVGFDNLFVASGDAGGVTNFASFALYFTGFGLTVSLARWLAAKVGG